MSACNKSGAFSISGRWQIVSDDKSLAGGPLVGSETYIGKDDDYFDFRAANTLYIKEDGQYDTVQYKLLSNDKIILTGKNFSLVGTSEASNITVSANQAIIVVYPAGVITPAGGVKRTIILKR